MNFLKHILYKFDLQSTHRTTWFSRWLLPLAAVEGVCCYVIKDMKDEGKTVEILDNLCREYFKVE